MQFAEPVSKKLPAEGSQFRIRKEGEFKKDGLKIYIHKPVLLEIIEYSKTNLDRELGGCMYGGYYQDEVANEIFIEIDSYIKAKLGESKSASFKFNADTWTDIGQIKEERFPEKLMVGWHHTHPRFGLFLSSMDMFIHQNFFNLPFQVAMVVDPVADNLAFFQWRGDVMEDCGFFLITPKKSS